MFGQQLVTQETQNMTTSMTTKYTKSQTAERGYITERTVIIATNTLIVSQTA